MPIVRAVIFCVGKKKLTVDLTDLVSGLIKVNRPKQKINNLSNRERICNNNANWKAEAGL